MSMLNKKILIGLLAASASLVGAALADEGKDQTAVDRAEEESAGYRAVSAVSVLKQHHAVAMVTLVKGTQFKSLSESLE
jgi:hypothetical protein